MQQLNFTGFNHYGQNSTAERQNMLMQSLFDDFERQHNIHVNFEIIDWRIGWTRLVEIALYERGIDISEVGSTWIVDLVRMHALKSFSPLDIKQIGSGNDFVSENWKAGVTSNTIDAEPVVWGIPWISDVRFINYRRDFLEKANIDPTLAFKNVEALDNTIAALKEHGFEIPVLFATLRSHINIQQMASWIWACGGDFMSPDGKRVAFDSPQALKGMKYYFGLGKYIPAQYHKISEPEVDPLFISGKVALLFSGAWLMEPSSLNPIQANLGLAPMPGAPFTGGSHLVIWKHSPKSEAALLLLDFMIKHSAKHKLFPSFQLPAYLPTWTDETKFIEEPYFSAFRKALQSGRSFPTNELWGLVEKRLADIIPSIWEKVLASDNPDIDKILAETIIPLAKVLNLSLDAFDMASRVSATLLKL